MQHSAQQTQSLCRIIVLCLPPICCPSFLSVSAPRKHEVFQQRGCFVHTEYGGVDGDVVVLRSAPILAGVEIVVGGALFVRLANQRARARLAELMPLHHHRQPIFQRSVDKDARQPFVGGKQVVRAAADDHAVLLRRQLADGVRLNGEELIAEHHVVDAHRRNVSAVAGHRQRVQEAAGGAFVRALERILADSRGFSRFFQKLFGKGD